MLKSILKLEGAEELGKNETRQINGGFGGLGGGGGCFGEGDPCDPNDPDWYEIPCLGGEEILCCVGGTLVVYGVTYGCPY